MNPTRSTSLRRDEESRSTRNEDHNLWSRTEEEKRRRRQEWKFEQEMVRQHERLKHKMILDYEKRRAQALKADRKSSHRSRSRSDSKSPSYRHHKERSTLSASTSDNIFEKLNESKSGAVPLFKGPENPQIDPMELRNIKVNIHRNIPVKGSVTELQRDILNPEDVVLKRREGEGCKPIFEREDIKKVAIKAEAEERTVVAIDAGQSVLRIKSQTSKKYPSSSPIRNRNYNPGCSSYQSRYRTDLKHNDRTEYRDRHKSGREDTVETCTEYKEKSRDERDAQNRENYSRSRDTIATSSRDTTVHQNQNHNRDSYSHDNNRDSHNRDSHNRDSHNRDSHNRDSHNRDSHNRDSHNHNRDNHNRYHHHHQQQLHSTTINQRYTSIYHLPITNSMVLPCSSNSRSFIENRPYRDKSRDRSSERSHERRNRDRDRSRERRGVTEHYIEQVPVPIYCGNFPPSPIVISPMVPIRGPIPPMGRIRHPALMAPGGPFPPRFIPPDMYRMRPPAPNQRYGPML